MWAFNPDQSANNNQNPNMGWNVGNANAGGGENHEVYEKPATYVYGMLLLTQLSDHRT